MEISRRNFALGAVVLIVAASTRRPAVARSIGQRVPNAGSLQSGDFLWPKKPGAFIPYGLNAGKDADVDRDNWLQEKERFIAKARASGDPQLTAASNRLATLTYNDFRALYLRNQNPVAITPYSLGGIAAVGHVAIIEVDQAGHPWVIEALWAPGVTRSTYSDWLAGRPGEIVWHGRLKGETQTSRSKIANEAARWIGSPYDFWNFDLNDTRGFYCSKLVWFCVMKALHIPIDGDSNPARTIWLSPKQMLYSESIDRLVDPGEYGID
jgi:hypothetical protein